MNDLPNDALEDLLHDFGAEGRQSVPQSIAARALKKDLCSTISSQICESRRHAICSTSAQNFCLLEYSGGSNGLLLDRK